ncbi:long-chain fatty acid--CoA ligase [Glycomyces sp. TRM65418]|uniref:AMP-binding protein n=1 Tax=Glycomyces sp. TRM65418 TaxID=2867006 RepID=UPI001CE573F3|nr:AMP-binding protein [Glycomyces sp. TRM65418]MCC3765507.1 long-chain fatty acid--CoA ligase [Glycomyces sp. TRM65418]QZD55114.1 long-chain fatty acid--CoA ligase [Glycomyces sp. TRM65418]
MTTPQLLAGLMDSRARLNGVEVAGLAAGFRRSPAFSGPGDLRGRVVAVDEPDAVSTIGVMAAAWERGAVSLLSGVPAGQTPWGKGAPGSRLVPEAVTAEWDLPEDCALVQATSGSSGTPRLAMRSHASFEWESRAYAAVWGAGAHPLVHCVRLQHSLGIGITLSALLAGRDVWHADPIRANRLRGFGDRIGVLAGTPATLRVLNEALAAREVQADTVFCAAGALDPRLRGVLERRWGNGIVLGFGSTETGGVLAGPRGIGAPVPGAELLDAPIGTEPFQLKVRFPHEVLGYVGSPSRTRVWDFPDLVRRGDDGQLEHVARMTRTMRTRDRTQALARLADALKTMDRDWRLLEPSGDTGTLSLLLEGGPLSEVDEARLRDAGGAVIGGAAIRTIPRFPRNDEGKVELAKLFAANHDPGPPRHARKAATA